MVGTLDSQVIEKFKEFQKQTNKYHDLKIEEIKFENIPLSNEEHFKITMGQSPEGKSLNNHSEGIPFYQGKTDFGEQFLNSPTTWTTKSKKEATIDDVLISLRAPAGAVNIANIDLSIGRGLASIRCLTDINNKYIFYYLKNNENKINIENNKGGFFSSMDKGYLHSLEIPIPQNYHEYKSLKLQNIIVEFLEFWKKNYTDVFRVTVTKQKPIMDKIKKALIPATLKYDKTIEKSFNEYIKNKEMNLTLSQIEFEDKNITRIVDISRGQVISKKDLKENGQYPVYSSQTKKDGLFGFIDDYMYDGDAITWTTDGKHAGTTFLRSGRFNYTNICGLMTIKDNIDVNIHYLSYMTRLIFPKHVDRTSQNSKLMTHHLDDIVIPIPNSSEIDSQELQILVMEFWETIFNNINNQFKKFENIARLTDKIDEAFLYRTFSKMEWSEE
jgi:type I restriction enzyme S subunit